MLSEEEKKDIERLKERINDSEDYKTVQVWLIDDVVAVNTVLNLTTKLQKENEEKDKQIDLMGERLRYDEDLKYEVCRECEPLKEELCGEPKKTQFEPTELDCVKQYFAKLAKKGE